MVLSGRPQLESRLAVKARPDHAEETCVSTTLSCGQCRAPLRAEQDWCSLCFASVETSFDPLTAPLDQVVGRAEVPELPVAPVEPLPAVPVIAEADPTPDPVARPIEVSDLDVMFSMLAAEHRRSEPAAGIAERLEDRSTRIAVMVGGTVLIGAVMFLVLTVLGAIV